MRGPGQGGALADDVCLCVCARAGALWEEELDPADDADQADAGLCESRDGEWGCGGHGEAVLILGVQCFLQSALTIAVVRSYSALDWIGLC